MAAQTQLEYFLDVVLRNYCRTAEENEILYEEMSDLRGAMATLFTENADLRFRLKELGVELPVSEFVTAEELEQIQ